MRRFSFAIVFFLLTISITCLANSQNADKNAQINSNQSQDSVQISITNQEKKHFVKRDINPQQEMSPNDDASAQQKLEAEHTNSWTVFFILCVLGLSILLIHLLIQVKFHYLPESVAVIFLGAIIGLVLKLLANAKIADWSNEEAFTPTMFFLILLPPIIFESGYNMHKGNFFQNIGSILVFAIFGTVISAFVMGAGIYILGQIHLTHSLSARDSFAFGSLVSAVDPVATLAIFNALEIDPVLYMLVFGESILNDAVAIVLTNTIINLSVTPLGFFSLVGYIIVKFCLMFFASAFIGCVFGLLSALLFKYIDLRKTPSLEIAFMFIFMYSPYVFAEAIKMSGIMAILFSGIVMSHYTHLNLSSVSRITVQQIFRTLSFTAETCVFAYLGMAIFSFQHIFKPTLVISSIVMCLASRACNIFPLSFVLNHFREHKITKRMQFVMWFSGMRGAIAFALSLNLPIEKETRHVIVTSTLILVLFTTLFLGGSTLPILKFMNAEKNNRKPKAPFISLSKTKEMGDDLLLGGDDNNINSNHRASELGEDEVNIHIPSGARLRGFVRFDEAYLKPFFIRKFTDEELRDGQFTMNKLTKQWFDDANQDMKNGSKLTPQARVLYKKSSTKTKNVNESEELKLNKSGLNASSVLLESTDDDDDDDDFIMNKSSSLLNSN